jgi:hypothetical protein
MNRHELLTTMVTTVFAAAVSVGAYAQEAQSSPATAAKPAVAKPAAIAKPAAPVKSDLEKKVDAGVRELDARYKLTDEQKTRLAALVKSQIEQEAAWTQQNEAKLKALDEQAKKLAEERKAVDDSRAAMKAEQRKAIETVITPEQRLAAVMNELLSRDAGRYLAVLDDSAKGKLNDAAKTAATDLMGIVETDAKKRRDAEAAVLAKMREATAGVVTTEVRQKGETGALYGSVTRSLRNVKLEADQEAKVKALCEAAAKQKLDLASEQALLGRKLDELRAKQQGRPEGEIQKRIVDEILTAEQKDAMQGKAKPKTAQPKDPNAKAAKGAAEAAK